MKFIGYSILTVLVFFVLAFLFTGGDPSTKSAGQTPANNVSMNEGVQIIGIQAKGGYLPRMSTAKAGTPTVLRINTMGTFDCSAALSIPSLGIHRTLPRSGATDIDIGSPKAGILKGTCSMGMYNFEIDFRG